MGAGFQDSVSGTVPKSYLMAINTKEIMIPRCANISTAVWITSHEKNPLHDICVTAATLTTFNNRIPAPTSDIVKQFFKKVRRNLQEKGIANIVR